MVYSFLASPFADSAREAQYTAVLAALQADTTTDSLLLGNLVLEDGAAPLDAVVVRPHSITLVVLVPKGGRLSIPALGYGRWQLGGVPLTGADDFDNPFEQMVQQKLELEAWLSPRFTPEQANLRFITSLVLFGAPVTYAPDVELALNSAPAGFQLLSDPVDLPRRLRQLATPEIDLTAEDLAEWAAEWAAFAESRPAPDASNARPTATAQPRESAAPTQPASFLGQKAGALWRWLGADDVPDDDPAYGYDPTAAAARTEEKQQLEHLRQQMQADLTGQLQALEAREAERERSIAQLRAELAQAPAVAPEAAALEARLAIENREKAALEAAMQASRAESAARNQELDAKIQQLAQLIEKLNSQPAAPEPASPRVAAAAPVNEKATPSAMAAPSQAASTRARRPAANRLPGWAAVAGRQLRSWRQPRVAMAAAGLVTLALVVWGLSHLGASPPVPYQENGRWGYADADGTPVVPAQYSVASAFQSGQAVVAKDGAYGVIDEKGKEVVAPAYDAMNPFQGGYARVRVGDAYTFIDQNGEEFDYFYFNALDFTEGHAAVLDHRGWHYITGPDAPESNAPIFIEAYSFAEGLARVKLADGYTFITPDYLEDPSSGTAPFGRYSQAADFGNGKAWVMQDGRNFLINKKGEEVQ